MYRDLEEYKPGQHIQQNAPEPEPGLETKENVYVSNRWEHKAILMLISEYKAALSLFSSSSVRNDVAWKSISSKLCENGYKSTTTQCENKFKNLKRQYQKKIDSMRNTGAAAVKFDYFSEFDDIFGKKPSTKPVAIASSRRETVIRHENTEDVLEETTIAKENTSELDDGKENISSNTVNKRKTKADKFLEHIKEIEDQKEETKRKRHEELIALQRQAIDVFAKKMDKLIDKL